MTEAFSPTLYNYYRSSASWRVRIALALKSVSYAYRPVPLLTGEQRSEPHLAKNPMGQVPVLEWTEGGEVRSLSQSIAIMDYLEQRFPEPALLPRDPYRRALALQMTEMINAGIQPLQNLFVMQTLKGLGVDERAFSRGAIVRGLDALETVAKPLASPFLAGDEPSWADICLIPQLYNARRFECALEAWPTLLRAEAAAEALEAFQAAHPSQQPDAPEEA